MQTEKSRAEKNLRQFISNFVKDNFEYCNTRGGIEIYHINKVNGIKQLVSTHHLDYSKRIVLSKKESYEFFEIYRNAKCFLANELEDVIDNQILISWNELPKKEC